MKNFIINVITADTKKLAFSFFKTQLLFYFEKFFFSNINVFFLIIFFIICILVFSAAFTLTERKIMAIFQRREGPDRVGIEGMGQPAADGMKLIKKQVLQPKDNPEPLLFDVAPIISFSAGITTWVFIPLNNQGAFVNSDVSLILIFSISSFGAYGVIFAGWVSNNKFAFMGALRSVAQLISYEIIFSVLFMPIISASGSFNITEFVYSQVCSNSYGFVFFPLSFMFVIVALAETNRTPFDLPEAEAELVSGYNVEYSSLLFALFFLAEYSSMGSIAALFIASMFSGWNLSSSLFFFENCNSNYIFSSITTKWVEANYIFFFDYNFIFYSLVSALKILIFAIIFIQIRASLPRKRFDQMIHLCWKYFFPLSFSIVIFFIGLNSFFIMVNHNFFCFN